MLKNILLIVSILAVEAGIAYYCLVVNGGLFMRFIFFLISTALICLLVMKGIRYILPSEHYSESSEPEDD